MSHVIDNTASDAAVSHTLSAVEAISAPPDVRRTKSKRRRIRPRLLLALFWLGLVLLLALTADILPLKGPGEISSIVSRPPGLRIDEPLGTDQLGRSQLSRVIYGARVSLVVALVATAIGLTLGLTLGLIAGYRKGVTDHVFDIGTNTLLAFPPLVFLLVVTAALPTSHWSLTLALGVVTMPTFARLARANTIALVPREYIVAARSLGAGHRRILIRELLPNVSLPLLSYSVVVVSAVIVAEGSLSFLGLGVPPPTPSWGGMIAVAREYISTAPQLLIVPAVTMFLTIFAINIVGDWARSRFGKEATL
jgi:peptide/nickel transport system permease protein